MLLCFEKNFVNVWKNFKLYWKSWKFFKNFLKSKIYQILNNFTKLTKIWIFCSYQGSLLAEAWALSYPLQMFLFGGTIHLFPLPAHILSLCPPPDFYVTSRLCRHGHGFQTLAQLTLRSQDGCSEFNVHTRDVTVYTRNSSISCIVYRVYTYIHEIL